MCLTPTSIKAYRRSAVDLSPTADDDPLPAVVFTCSDSYRANLLIASARPVSVHQSLGPQIFDAQGHLDAGAAATIDLATGKLGARTIILSGHAQCHAVLPRDDASRKRRLIIEAKRLFDSGPVGDRLRSGDLTLRVLWFDEDEGDVFAYDPKTSRFTLLGDDDLARVWAPDR